MVKRLYVPKTYRDHFEKIRDLVADEVGSKGDELLSFKITSMTRDDEAECLYVSYEAWMVSSNARNNDVILEESAWFEVAPSKNGAGGLDFELLEWHEGGVSEYDVVTERLPRGIFKAWVEQHGDDLYYRFADSEEELDGCRPCVIKAFRRLKREMDELEAASSAGYERKGRLQTGGF